MIVKRIIPCLDVSHGRVVKGSNFQEVNDVANPVDLAKFYSQEGADELVFYDIMASVEDRALFIDILEECAQHIFIPLTVGGAIRTVDDFSRVLNAGADKVSVNSGALLKPELIEAAANRFGSQCVVISIDVKRVENQFHVFTKGGRVDTGRSLVDWAQEAVGRGAGEIVLNSIDADGIKEGFDIEMLSSIAHIQVPIIASGGAGSSKDFVDLFQQLPSIDAGLAASIFHFGVLSIADLKQDLAKAGIRTRV